VAIRFVTEFGRVIGLSPKRADEAVQAVIAEESAISV